MVLTAICLIIPRGLAANADSAASRADKAVTLV